MSSKTNGKQKIVIIGGVAGGASCATRARRLSEGAEIIMLERGPYVSFANCGLPYYIGNVITDEDELLVATPELFKDRFNIEVRTENEAQAIDRQKRQVMVKDLTTGREYSEDYDALVIATGSSPIRPPLPGIDLPGIFTLRNIPDSRQIKKWLADNQVKKAVIVGGGAIGLEMCENLTRLGIAVTILEMLPQVMPPLDPEMAALISEQLTTQGVVLHLGDAVAAFSANPDKTIRVTTSQGQEVDTDIVILSIGVRPEAALARNAGLEMGDRGGIRVNESLQTSDPRIWAVGDVVEVRDFITGEWALIPLAGPANRQGRLAADAIMGRKVSFRGVQGSWVCQVFNLTVAATGANEKTLQRGIGGQPVAYEKVYLHPNHHVGYYPEAKPMVIKLIFATADGKILGAQAIGEAGVEKRIDVIAMAVQQRATVFDLEESELCYAPQFGAAKDPVNLAGMVAANILRGDVAVVHWEDVNKKQATLLDVREPEEFREGHAEGAINIPLPTLRERIAELPHDGEIQVYCSAGQRSYYASRMLTQNGFNAKNIPGGFKTQQAKKPPQQR